MFEYFSPSLQANFQFIQQKITPPEVSYVGSGYPHGKVPCDFCREMSSTKPLSALQACARRIVPKQNCGADSFFFFFCLAGVSMHLV
jgi:hypothetical protein